MGNPLPITSKLLPRAGNWMYLAEVAVLTRVLTGIMRVLVNSPSQQKDPKLSKNQKRQALIERFFVEIVGTACYMAFLHLGQDLVNLAYKPKVPHITLAGKDISQELRHALTDLGLCVNKFDQHINDYLKEVYTPGAKPGDAKAKNLIYRVLYGDSKTGMANMEALKNKFAELSEVKAKNLSQEHLDKAFNKIVNEVAELKQFAMKNNVWASAAILLGVAVSAWAGGTGIQKMCDGPVASTAKMVLDKHYRKDSKVRGPAAPSQPVAVSQVGGEPDKQQEPAMVAPPAPAKTLSLVSEAPPLLPPVQSPQSQQSGPQSLQTLYLPNPKQPTATPFAIGKMLPYHMPQPFPFIRVGGA